MSNTNQSVIGSSMAHTSHLLSPLGQQVFTWFVPSSAFNQVFQFVPGLTALHRMPFSLRYKGTAEQRR
jgi:hypothetical protein